MSKKVLALKTLAHRQNMGLPVNNSSDSPVIYCSFIDNLGVFVDATGATGGTLYVQGAMEYTGLYVDLVFDPPLPALPGSPPFLINLNQYPYPIFFIGYSPTATATVAAAVVVQALTYTAQEIGSNGNAITITYTNPGTPNSPLSVTAVGTAITVSLGTNGASALISTASQVKAAVEASMTAAALVSVVISGSPAAVQAADSQTLVGGDGDAGYLTLQVSGKEI